MEEKRNDARTTRPYNGFPERMIRREMIDVTDA